MKGKGQKKVKEIRVSYGETRPTKRQYAVDRLDVGITRELLPDEDYEDALEEETKNLADFVKAYMKGRV